MHEDVKTTTIIAATIKDGEPRYVMTTLDYGVFEQFKIGHRYEVMTEWDGHMGVLLIPYDEEEEHEARRRNLGNATLADMRTGNCVGGFMASIMADMDKMRREQ